MSKDTAVATPRKISFRIRPHNRKKPTRTLWSWLFIFIVSALCTSSFGGTMFFLGRATVRVPIIQTMNPRTGEWTRLDLSNHRIVSLFCGNADIGYPCAIVRLQDHIDDATGDGLLLTPSLDSDSATPPAGPNTGDRKEHSNTFEKQQLTTGVQ